MTNFRINFGMILFTLAFCLSGFQVGWHAGQVYAQQPPASKYAPTDSQLKRLQVPYLSAQVSQRDMLLAQQRMQQALAQLQDEARKVKEENKWGAEVKFDPDTLSFSDPAPEKKP